MRSERDHPSHPPVTRPSTAFTADLVKAARRLVRAPGYACLAILALTVGIGVNAGMVGFLDALLIRLPSSVGDARDLARLHFRLTDGNESVTVANTTYPTVRDIASSSAYHSVAAYATRQVSIGRGADAYAGRAMLTSAAFFSVLRPAAALGRLPSAEPEADSSPDLAVVSYGFWQSYFGGRRDIIGAALPVDGRIYTITAVTAPDFHILSTQPTDVWLPLEHASIAGRASSDWREDRESFWLGVVARRWSNATAAGAEQRADAYLQQVRSTLHNEELPVGVEAQSIVPGRGPEKPTETKVALWLSGVSSIVLLIACVNVSSLILTRMLARRREYFLRIALGASARQLRRQMFADIGVILLPGTIGAAVACFVLRNALAALMRSDVPISREFLDARTNAFLLASAAVAFVIICIVSLFQLRSVTREQTVLSRTAETRALSRSTRRVILASQAGLSFILLCVAGFFAGSLARLNALDLGIDLDHTLQVTISRSRSDTSLDITEVLERAQATLVQNPRIARVALTDGSPYKSGMGAGPWTDERGAVELWTGRESAYKSFVGPGFFSTVGATSLRGRDFQETDRDGAERVAILNAPLATYLWPSGTALGKCMWLDTTDYCYRIVGVLDGVWKLRVLEREKMAVYLPIAQAPGAVANTMFVRTRGDADALAEQVRTIVQSLSPDLPAVQVLPVETLVAPEFRPWRLGATVFAAFAVIALLLTLSGVYGIVAFITSLRLREIGVRMALGAGWRHVLASVVGESLVAIMGGMVVGSLAVLVAGHWLTEVMFEASARDLIVILEAGGVLLLVATAAVAIPAIRALRIDPMTVLRSD